VIVSFNNRERSVEGGMRDDDREAQPFEKAVAVLVGFTISIVIWHITQLLW
jgi:hypothetical protein